MKADQKLSKNLNEKAKKVSKSQLTNLIKRSYLCKILKSYNEPLVPFLAEK